VIDFVILLSVIAAINKLGIYIGLFTGFLGVEILMFVLLPLGFFIYWWVGLHLGKRLFGLKIVDANSGKPPSAWQYFRRCLLFSLVVSLNLVFLLPLFLSKRNQGFQDMLANTLVVRDKKE